jgi:hypothetical protein
MKWQRPNPDHSPIRVHWMRPDSSVTLCGVLNIETTPYLNVPGHAAIPTIEDVTCLSCLRMVPAMHPDV